MKKNFTVFSALVLGLAVLAHAQTATPSKVAIIHVQNAILSTKDGQKAQGDLQTKFNPDGHPVAAGSDEEGQRHHE